MASTADRPHRWACLYACIRACVQPTSNAPALTWQWLTFAKVADVAAAVFIAVAVLARRELEVWATCRGRKGGCKLERQLPCWAVTLHDGGACSRTAQCHVLSELLRTTKKACAGCGCPTVRTVQKYSAAAYEH